MIDALKAFALFAVTAAAEIGGCYLVFLWLRKGASAWLLFPAAASLALAGMAVIVLQPAR